MGIQQMPKVEPRVETGAVQFGDDWPGYFIRGDGACYLAICINSVLSQLTANQLKDVFFHATELQGLADAINANTNLANKEQEK